MDASRFASAASKLTHSSYSRRYMTSVTQASGAVQMTRALSQLGSGLITVLSWIDTYRRTAQVAHCSAAARAQLVMLNGFILTHQINIIIAW